MTNERTRDLIAAFASSPASSALLVDFDGTLAPIVKDPRTARLAPMQIDLLHDVANLIGSCCVVSGRPGAFLAERLDLSAGRASKLRAYGRGGLDVVDSFGTVVEDDAFGHWLPTMHAIALEARSIAPAAWIEEKGVVLTLHWRRAPQSEPALRALVKHYRTTGSLAARDGKSSIELFPHDIPTKATVVRDLARDATCVAFIGDDVGDLEAFDALDACDIRVQTFRGCVRDEETPAALVERADFVFDSPNETFALFAQICEFMRQ